MEKKIKFSTSKFLVVTVVLLVIVFMLTGYFLFVKPQPTKGEKEITLKIEYKDETFKYNVSTNTTTVLEFLKEQDKMLNLRIEYKTSEYGEFIVSMMDKDEDSVGGFYYTYTIDGLDFANGISIQTIKDKDVITFQYKSTIYDDNWNEVSSTLGSGGTNPLTSKDIWLIVILSVSLLLILGAVGFIIRDLIYQAKKRKFALENGQATKIENNIHIDKKCDTDENEKK